MFNHRDYMFGGLLGTVVSLAATRLAGTNEIDLDEDEVHVEGVETTGLDDSDEHFN